MKRISLIGHREGIIIAPSIALENLTDIENVVLMGLVNLFDVVNFQMVRNPLLYAKQILDKNDTGVIPISAIVRDMMIYFIYLY